jgi:hypothetical protein
MTMTAKEMETIQRMLGVIEGASFNSGKREIIIADAVETIYGVLDKAEIVMGGEQK